MEIICERCGEAGEMILWSHTPVPFEFVFALCRACLDKLNEMTAEKGETDEF